MWAAYRYRYSQRNSNGASSKVRNGPDWGAVQIHLLGSPPLYWYSISQTTGTAGNLKFWKFFHLLIINYYACFKKCAICRNAWKLDVNTQTSNGVKGARIFQLKRLSALDPIWIICSHSETINENDIIIIIQLVTTYFFRKTSKVTQGIIVNDFFFDKF